jgi:SLT domain-containing protein
MNALGLGKKSSSSSSSSSDISQQKTTLQDQIDSLQSQIASATDASQKSMLQSSLNAAQDQMAALAEGGIVNSPTFALIGEAGPEAVVPLGSSNSSVFGAPGVSPLDMNAVSAGGGSGVGTQNNNMEFQNQITIHIDGLSSNATLQDIINALTEGVKRGQAESLVTQISQAINLQQVRRRY